MVGGKTPDKHLRIFTEPPVTITRARVGGGVKRHACGHIKALEFQFGLRGEEKDEKGQTFREYPVHGTRTKETRHFHL